ncbi:MAG: lipid A deacylase LpxR family protein [Gammaproteobacteria bacterium]|nr:lipid A deacylase LpxR family protein [Gammaproteobacteria bacterium]
MAVNYLRDGSFFGCLLLAVFAVTPVQADAGRDDKGVFSLAVENDLFADVDSHYTHGTRLSWLSPERDLPPWMARWSDRMPLFAEGGVNRFSFVFGQNIFTPDDITRPELIADDRPYAGWLYGSVGVISDTGTRLDNLELTLGMVGPAALARHSQRIVHDIVDADDPKGWDNQLANEPGIVLTYERKWRSLLVLGGDGLATDFTPHVGGSLGNIFTHLSLGMTGRIGFDLPADYGPPRIRPSLPGSDFFHPTRGLGGYLFAGFEGRFVARNLFLDGNTFQSSHHVKRKPLVGDFQLGAAIIWREVRLAYTHIFRSREFDGQQNYDQFGAVTVSLRFR